MTQLDFLQEVLPLEPPMWIGTGLWACPRCWPSQYRITKVLAGLVFSPDGAYKVGRCWSCGYWVRFEDEFGKKSFSSGEPGKVIEYGADDNRA